MANANARRLRKAMTPQEVKLWQHLRTWRRDRGFHFRRQVPKLGYILDFARVTSKIVVEIDGSQHGDEPYARRDAERDRRLSEAGFIVLRFWNNDVDGNLEGVLETILTTLGGTPPTGRRPVPPPHPADGEG